MNSKKIKNINIRSTSLYLSSLARNLSYQFQIQNISTNCKPTETSFQPNYFVLYRDKNDVQFFGNKYDDCFVIINYFGK